MNNPSDNDFKYFTLEGKHSVGQYEKSTLHKIKGEIIASNGQFLGYSLACGTAVFAGYGRFSLKANYNRPAAVSVTANHVDEKIICPICFPKGLEQE